MTGGAPAASRIHDVIAPAVASAPGQTAIVAGAERWSYRQFGAAVEAAARTLGELGVRAGDRVMVLAENCAAVPVLFFAASRVDAWPVIVNARLSPREVDTLIEHCSPRRVIFTHAVSRDAQAHAERVGAALLALEGAGEVMASAVHADARVEPTQHDPCAQVAALIYTSGTTGQPKGVMLSHANLSFVAATSVRIRRVTPADVVYAGLPFSHVFGLASVMLATLSAGATLYVVPRFTAAGLADSLAQGVSVVPGVPAMYARLLEHVRAHGGALTAPRLRFCYAGGAPLEPALKQAAEQLLGTPLHNGYGLTETSPTVSMTRIDAPAADLSVGPPAEGVEVRIVGSDERQVEAGAIGELWVRGPNIMLGYYRAPELTAAVMRPGGWFNTGDLARIDRAGCLFIVGRTKELIIRSGFNVYPIEVEAILGAHPDVAQCAVVGRTVEGNEEVIAFVEPHPGRVIDADALLRFAAERLAPYKRPAEVLVLDPLPVAATGKILKARLRELANAPRTG